MGRDDPQISMDPPEFIFALHSMIDVEYHLWGSGVPNAGQLLKGLDYEEFNITCLMPFLTAWVCAHLLLFFFLVFVTTSNDRKL